MLNSIQLKTKNAFEDINNSELKDLPGVCMKQYSKTNSGYDHFGIIFKKDIENKNYIITNRDNANDVFKYETIDNMLEDGWVVD